MSPLERLDWLVEVSRCCGPSTVVVAVALATNGKNADPSRCDLASITRLSVSTVKRALRDLAAGGLIERYDQPGRATRIELSRRSA